MKAYELLTPETWCQGALARTQSGNKTHASSPTACRWCMIGALHKTYGQVTDDMRRALRRAILLEFNITQSPTIFNDSHTVEQVIQVLKAADL